MTGAWLAFAKTGDPNTTNLKWEAYTNNGGATMIFDEDTRLVYNHDKKLIQLLAALWRGLLFLFGRSSQNFVLPKHFFYVNITHQNFMCAEKINEKKLTYISLFSSAGVGCYGFKMADYNCIATNELIPRRLEIQKFNSKCKYESGYICGNIKEESTKAALFSQIDLWKRKEDLKRVDVLIATPPCQGMSVANHKKAENEIIRNSLVVESIKIIKEVNPKFFVFENVPAFMKTVCTDIDGQEKPISQAIENNLGEMYSYISRVINFKDYGACSSRQRTLVIGVSKEFSDEISPVDLFPSIEKEKTLRQVIGNFKSLNFGEIDKDDFYHAFRTYPDHMRTWIHDLKEGESAFDNKDIEKIPHQVKNGQIVINKRKNADKYTRQYWDKVGPCVHTRNDQLASQNTIHPQDDRVFSIRELMKMMTIPDNFRWISKSLEELNTLPEKEKSKLLKKEAVKIRQSIGEAVPTKIFNKIAENIKQAVSYDVKTVAEINKIISKFELSQKKNLVSFINENPLNISLSKAGRIRENIEENEIPRQVDIIYEFPRFLHVLSVGFDEDDIETIEDMDFNSVMNVINGHYAKI